MKLIIYHNIVKVSHMLLLWAILIITVQAQPIDNVVAYYPFLGNVLDAHGNGKNCTNSGATLTSDRLGKANAAYSFNGSSNLMYMPVNLIYPGNAFAISCWLKPLGNHSSPENWQTFIDLRGQYQIVLSYYQPNNPTPNAIQFNMYSGTTAAVITSLSNSIPLNTWSHIVASYGNNTMSLYINGNLVGTQTSNPPNSTFGYNYNNTLGKDYGTWLNRGWFNGCIDEVLFYNRALTSSEIQTLYNRGLTTSEISELIPIKFTYDQLGNRINRNRIVKLTKSAILHRDSAGIDLTFNGNISGEKYEEKIGEQMVVIYPNPTQGQLKVEIQGLENETNSALYLFDLNGKLLITKKPLNSSMDLDLSIYSIGNYVMKIVLGDKKSEWKIVKE